MEIISSAVAAKLLAPIAAAAFKHVAASAGAAFSARNKLGLPGRSQVGEMTSFLESNIRAGVNDGDLDEELLRYVKSPESTTLMEHILCFRAMGRPITKDGPLRRELSRGCERYGLAVSSELDSLFRILVGAAEAILKYAGVVGTEDVREKSSSAAVFGLNEAYLQSIDAQIELLTRPLLVNVDAIDSALPKYRSVLRSIVGKLQPPNFDGSDAVALNRLFVVPELTTEDEDNQRYGVGLLDLITMHRAVILGDPGGGKTTLTKKIALELTDGLLLEPSDEKVSVLVPFIIVLREFGAFLGRAPGSVADFISEALKSTYQTTLSSAEVEYLFTIGRAYVIFDGLDELLDSRDRQRVADIVTGFAALYTNARVLVTSRRVGYLQAPLPIDQFVRLSLEGFETHQIEQYVRNWFSLIGDLTTERREELASGFIAESADVPELQSSPLMLALICTIYRFEGYIPRNRPDVYEKCSRMLFDRWDRHRGLRRQFEFEAHIEPALMSLAYQIYLDPSLQSGITERHLVEKAAEYLDEWQYDNRILAESAAREFVDFCKGRAWVFTDVGLTPDGESLYTFTHRTFLEFFTGAHLARMDVSFDNLLDLIVEKVRRSEWDVVAQLALQIRTKNRQRGPDFAATVLLDAAETENESGCKRNLIAFLTRCLAFLPLSPRCARDVGSRMMDASFEHDLRSLEGAVDMIGSTVASELIKGVAVGSAREIRGVLTGAIAGRLIGILDEYAELPDEPAIRHELACSLAFSLIHRHLRDTSIDDEVEARLKQLTFARLSANYTAWGVWVSVALYWNDRLSSAQLAIRVPVERCSFSSPQTGAGVSLVQPLYSALITVLGYMPSATKESFEKSLALLREYAARVNDSHPVPVAPEHPRPSLRALSANGRGFRGSKEEDVVQMQEIAEQDVLAVCLVIAFLHECDEKVNELLRWNELQRVLGRLSHLAGFFVLRNEGEGLEVGEGVLPTAGAYRDLLLSWSANGVALSIASDDG